MKSLLVFVALLGLVNSTHFFNCGSKAAGVSVTVQGCDKPPCILARGEKYSLAITFTPDHAIKELTAEAVAKISSIAVPWPGFDGAACKYLAKGASCPLPAKVPVTWEYPVEVLAAYPKVSTTVIFKLKDGSVTEACVRIPVRIVDKHH